MRAVSLEQTSVRLSELRHQVVDDVALTAVAFGLALAATQVKPELAFPLFAGGITAGYFALRSYWRRWELLDRLLLDRDAYAIPEVRRRGERAASRKNRRALAATIRDLLEAPELGCRARVRGAADELQALADELEDERLTLAPVSAVACERLVTDAVASPLLNPALPGEDVRLAVRRVRAGFEDSSQRRETP